jgi:hypothetical protein
MAKQWTPPSDGVVTKSTKFVPPSDAVEVKKKASSAGLESKKATEETSVFSWEDFSSVSPSENYNKKSLSQTSKTGQVFKGYPGKGDKEYLFENGRWYEDNTKKQYLEGQIKALEDKKSALKSVESELQRKLREKTINEAIVEKKKQLSQSNTKSLISDPLRVTALNKHFGKEASTSPSYKTFVGYPGKESNQYMISEDGNWMRKEKGQKEWHTLTDPTAVTALNRQFKQNVKVLPPTVAKKAQVENKIKNDFNTKIETVITSKLTDESEESVVDTLNKQFKGSGFTFTQEKIGSDRVLVTAPNGRDKKLIVTDNWTWKEDKEAASSLKSFMRQHSNEAYSAAEQAISENEGYFLTKDINAKNAALQAGSGQMQPEQRELKINTDGSLSYVGEEQLKKDRQKAISLDIEERLKAPEVRREYMNQKAAQFDEVRDRYKTKDLSDDDLRYAYAQIKSDDKEIKRHNDYVTDINKYTKDYNKSKEFHQGYVEDIQNKLRSGEISMEQYESEYKPKIEAEDARLKSQSDDISKDLSNLPKVEAATDKSLAQNFIIAESTGSVAGGMTYNFAKGLTDITRFFGVSKEEQDEMIREATGILTTEEYMNSTDRRDLTKAMFSITESLGAGMYKAIPVVGGVLSAASLYSMGYYELKDDLDSAVDENGDKLNISERDKIVMSGLYGVASAALERIGLDAVLGKSKIVNGVTSRIIKNAFKSIPKNASKEFIEAAITSSAKAYAANLATKTLVTQAAEGVTEAAQNLALASTKEVYDWAKETDYFNNKSGWEIAQDALYDGYLGALGAGVTHVATQAPQAVRLGVNNVYKKPEIEMLIQSAKTEGMDQALITNLKSSILKGKISKEEARDVVNSFQTVKGKVESMTPNLSADQQSVTLDLMLEKDRVSKEIEGKDPNLVVVQKARIGEIDKQIQKIGEDAVQKQTAGEVPVQSETGVSEEVAGGVPQPTTEQATTKVVGEKVKGEQAQTEVTKQEALNKERSKWEQLSQSNKKGVAQSAAQALEAFDENPVEFVKRELSGFEEGSKEYNEYKNLYDLLTAEPIQAPVSKMETTETAPSTEAELDFEVTPEITQEADALEKLLADEGVTIEAPVVEQPVGKTEELPITEEAPVVEPSGKTGQLPVEAEVVEEKPTETAPVAEAPVAAPTKKPKAPKKLTKKETLQKYNDHIDSLIKEEKEKSDRRIAQLANQRNSATGQRRTELTQEMQDLEFAFRAKKRGLDSKKDDNQAAIAFNENPARFRMSEGTQEEADTRNDEQAIVDKMNEASAEEKGLTRGEVPESVEVNPIEESSSLSKGLDKVLKFLGLKDKNSLLKRIEDFNGIPMILGMSDMLAAGTIKDSMGGDMVVDGGLLYNTLGKNVDLAWAGVTEDGANNQVKQARELYEANKEFFDRLWAEGKIPNGHVPMAIMRMGNTAVNSNEAVFRYLLPLVKSLPLKNRTAALRTYMQTLQSKAEGNAASYWFTELEEQMEIGNLASKEQVLEYLNNLAAEENKKNGESTKYKKIIAFTNSIKKNKAKGEERTFDDIREDLTKKLDNIVPFMLSTYIKSNKIKTLDGFLEAVVNESKKRAQGDKNIFSLPVRSFIFNSLVSPESTKGANSLAVIKTLLDGVKKADPTIFTARHIYDAIGEKSMLKANQGDVVGIMGIKVVDENGNPAGGAKKADHNNYGYGPEGRVIALIKNPKQGIDVFPEFRAKLARVFKPSKTGVYPKIDNAIQQTGGAFFMDAAFRGTAPAVDAMSDLKVLIGKLRFAFPEVSVATTQEEFDNFLEQEGIRAREKDGKVIYGVTKDGRIFLNPTEQTLRTPIHEFGHIWIDYLRSAASGKKGDMLLQKGFELVDGTPEYERALKEYGSRELALEEALVELMAVKGDTIISAAKKSQFLEWMNGVFKYIKENLTRSKDFAQTKIKDLTLDEFINIGLADLFSGQKISGKFDARTAGEASRARYSKAENISKIVDIAAKNGVSNEAIKLLLARKGFSISDINAAFVKKAAPIKKGSQKKVTVNEMSALKTQLRLEARAAREAKKDVNDKRKDLAKTISDMETTGKITTKQAQVIMSRLSKLNMDNPAKVDAFVEYAGRVFENAEFAQDVARANALKSKVKNNAKTKLGIANDLISEILKMASINPSLIPSKVFDTYLETMEMLGQRTAVLKLEERGELTRKVSEILNAVNEELSVASEMAERFEAYDKKEVDSEGKINFAKTLDNMVSDGTITEQDADIMRKYKSDIIEKESTKMTEEELEAEKKSLVSILQNETISNEALDNLPSRLERDLAKAIKALIKTDAVKSLNNATLKNMLKLVDNINNGFVPHYAQSMKERLISINSAPTVDNSVRKGKPLKVSSLTSRVKSLFTKNNYVTEMIRSVALGNIDQVFGDFKSNAIFEAMFEGSAKGIAAFNSELAKINDKLEKAKLDVAESLGQDPNKVTLSAFKTMTYLLQLEKDSNPDSKQVNNSVDFINETLSQIEKGSSTYTEMDAELLQDILDKYTNKKALVEKYGKPYESFNANQKSELELDNKKLYSSFNATEKAAIKTIQDVNDSMTEKAVYTAGIIRGDKINPIANYVPHVVLEEAIPGKEITGANDVANFSNSRKPSTKAKNLVERTGAVTAISFNPYKSTQNAAKNVLLDFHMTEPIRIARMTINETRKRMEEEGIYAQERMFLNAISNAYEEATQNVLASSFHNDELINKVIDYIARAGYQAVLGTSITRTASELLSNMSAVAFMNPAAFTTGVKEFSNYSNPEEGLDIMLNVGSSQTERVMGGNTQGGMLIDPAIRKSSVGMKDTKAKNKLMNTMQMIYNTSEIKEGVNITKTLSDTLMSSPDTIVTRPTWFGAFANEFEKVSGKKVDFDKIKANDEAYMNENAEAIKAAKEKADKAVFNLSATNNAYMGLLKNNISPDSKGIAKAIKVFDNYLTRFTTYEYLNARTAVYALAGQGMISKKQAVGLLAGVTTRMITYSLLTKALSSALLGLMGGDDDEDDDKTKMQKLGQAAASAATTLMLGRNFGNIARNIMGYGVEKMNEKYLTKLREGDYDAYQDAIQYTVVPQEKKGNMGKGVDTEQLLYNMLGPTGPFTKSLVYGIKKLTEADRVAPKESDSDAVKKKREEAVTRQQRERTERVPLEILGTAGFIPLYKDIRKAVNESIYADLKKSLKEQEANKEKKAEMLMGYESKSDMEESNPKLYERMYGEGGKYYRQEEIRLANENLKNKLKKIEKELRSGEISSTYARTLRKEAKFDKVQRIKEANR